MKIARRVIVGALCLALLVSALVLTVGASDTAPNFTVENYRDILEYYEEQPVFYFDFDTVEAGDYTHSAIVNAKPDTQSTEVVEGTDGDKYLSVVHPTRARDRGSVLFSWTGGGNTVGSFVFDYSFALEKGDARVVLYLSPDSTDSDKQVNFIVFNFESGALNVTYYDPSSDNEAKSVLTDKSGVPLKLDTGVRYDVSVRYTVTDSGASYTLGVVAGDKTYNSGSVSLGTAFKSVDLLKLGTGVVSMSSASTVNYYGVKAVGGTFMKDFDKRDAITANAFVGFLDMIQNDETLTIEDKLGIISAVKTIVNDHGFTTEDADLQNTIDLLFAYDILVYSDLLLECVANASDSMTYAQRVANAEEYGKYLDHIPEDLTPAGDFADDVRAALAAYQAELDTIAKIKTDSDALIAILESIDLLKEGNDSDYPYILSYYEQIAEITPYQGYPGIPEITPTYNKVIALKNGMDNSYQAFVDALATLADKDGKNILTRLDDYSAVKNAYYANATYPGIDAVLSSFETLDSEMKGIIELCDTFVNSVSSATYSSYVTAQEAYLDAALAVRDTVLANYSEYEGVVEAEADYVRIRADIAEKKEAAQLYIDKVNSLDGLTGTALRVAITEAEALREAGNVLGVNGVSEANIKLNVIKSTLDLTVSYKEYFAGVVAEISKADDLATLRALIDEAVLTKAVAEGGQYDGVDAADAAKLQAAIDSYNASVNAANGAFASVAENAVSIASGAVKSTPSAFGVVIALIKKIFE